MAGNATPINSYLNMILFLVATVAYYLALKPAFTWEIAHDDEQRTKWAKHNRLYLAIYVAVVGLTQWAGNCASMAATCGGAVPYGYVAAATLLPWFLLFGTIVAVVAAFPGLKTAFSNIVGYFYVSHGTSRVLNELLLDKTYATAHSTSPAETLRNTSNMVLRVYGNPSLLINQIVPANFDHYWDLLRPLMRNEWRNPATDEDRAKVTELRDQLFELVATRDGVGEAMWLLYAGILVVAVVQMNMTARGCPNQSAQEMTDNYNTYADQQAQATASAEAATSTTYTAK